jgi:predicted secreted protein
MNWSEITVQILIYVLFWFFSLFIVLPFGVRPAENPEPGHDPGAPVNPALKKKVIATSIVAAILWAGFFYLTDVLGLTMEKIFR